ncbi:MAG TPA: SDR family oxidoreductase [Streptosporangiaceae bacterium]|nr:SDR family oxidoreductase [Streptosporangiaceae bacterium]
MPAVRTVVVTGSASGMGAATRTRLEDAGQRVIGVDLHDADIVADLATQAGRQSAVDAVTGLSGGAIDGLVTWAGLTGLSSVAGSTLVSVNYFGTVALLAGLRPLLARGDQAAAVAISSNSTTCMPGVPADVTEHCLAGDEQAARAAADTAGAIRSYPASKIAVARWVRRCAPTADWAGCGIALNAVAPGTVETPMLRATREDPVIGKYVDAFPVPVGRPGQAAELASVVAFLLGPDARFCCGSVFFVDGGTDALLRPDDFPAPMS